MKFKVEVESQDGKVKREYIMEASNGEEWSREIRRIEREWVMETGILDFVITV